MHTEARTLGTSKEDSNKQARAQVQAYVRKLLGSSGQIGGQGMTGGSKLALPRNSSVGRTGETPRTLSRQLEAMAYTKSSKNSSTTGKSSAGNAWLISPIASTVKSIFDLFGGGSSSSQSTRYRTKSRTPFHIVESVSPESGSGAKSVNESAAGLTGVTSGLWSNGSATSTSSSLAGVLGISGTEGSGSMMNNRQLLVAALRRGLSESRGIADVLNEFQDGL